MLNAHVIDSWYFWWLCHFQLPLIKNRRKIFDEKMMIHRKNWKEERGQPQEQKKKYWINKQK